MSELAAICNFGTLEVRIVRDIFIVNMNSREAQNELRRSSEKTRKCIGSFCRTSEGQWFQILCFNNCRQQLLIGWWPSDQKWTSGTHLGDTEKIDHNIITHEVPRRDHFDHRTNFISNEGKAFCIGEGIEIVKSPVNDYRRSGCLERSIGSLKTSTLRFRKEKNRNPFGENDWDCPRSVTVFS